MIIKGRKGPYSVAMGRKSQFVQCRGAKDEYGVETIRMSPKIKEILR
jgi:hypothetical protein